MNAAAYLKTLNDSNPKFILLATDGVPTCGTAACAAGVNDSGMPNQCDDANAIAMVKTVHDMGYPTFVLGIGTSKAPGDGTLSQMAVNGGYPRNGTPQLVPKIISTQGFRSPIDETIVLPKRDIAPKESVNLRASLSLEPSVPIPAKKTLLFIDLDPVDGLELYLGAWAHMLIESHDLIDTIHAHPSAADSSGKMQFDIFFPREAIYRIWIQFQRQGKVNTVAFTLPVKALA